MKNATITTFIKITVLTCLLLYGFYIIKPFIGVLAWAIILAIALYPLYNALTKNMGAKPKKLVTFGLGLVILVILTTPAYYIFSSVTATTTTVISDIKNNTLEITPPSEAVKEWPLIGNKLYSNWTDLSENTQQYVKDHKEFILTKGKGLFSHLLGSLGAVLLFIIATIFAIILMYNANGSYQVSTSFLNKLVGDKSQMLLLIARDTIRNVVKGILLVAVIQAILCFIGFKLIGLPAAGLLALIIMLCGIVHIPITLVVLPMIALAFSVSDNSTHLTIFTIYILMISLLDNVLRPIFLAKGLKTPMILIIIGAIGGLLLQGIIGLFVGTVVLAVIHQIYQQWINETV